ncbi:hypothetical protein LEM8419_00799 [Neolewinella maritima]|uniref:Glycoside hydrolase family 28 protein n=1 Tax=Neolewinella maritima TaxID=1383882 RepID=A0ABN8EZV5_9BACT|nr:glycoside hydrolase family 28 protein [Neolewinella maritima]CAH0999499.1 hypothetical protein LEM8419_00799 [Neolewinella maritima]
MRLFSSISICYTLTLLACTQTPTAEGDFTADRAATVADSAWLTLPDRLARIQAPTFADRDFSVVDYGASDDSLTDSRPAILAAIAACNAAGGGRVVLPAGAWHSAGPLHLLSDVNLHLAEGARLTFSSEPADYLPAVEVRWEGTVVYNYSPFIYAKGQRNIAITGSGTIDGKARQWSMDWRKRQQADKDRLRKMGNDRLPDEQRVFADGFLDLDGDGSDDGYGDGKPHWLRPTLIEFYDCRNVLLEDFTARNSCFWTVHPTFCTNVTIRGLQVFGSTLNDDGVDPDSSTDVLIEDCYIRTHDDAISLKAGRDQDAWDRPGTSNVIVRNCRLASAVNAFCIGSEMSGGVEDVFVENVRIEDGKHAINFKSNLDRGGRVADVFLRDIDVDRVEESTFIFRMDYHGYRGNSFPTEFSDIYAEQIRVGYGGKVAFKIVGVPDAPIRRVYLKDFTIDSTRVISELLHTEDIVADAVTVGGTTWSPGAD